MSYAEAESKINARLASGFRALPVAWPGVPFDPKEDGSEGYVKPGFQDEAAEQADLSVANRRYRYPGLFVVEILLPSQGNGTAVGAGLALDHADALCTLFREWGTSLSNGRLQFGRYDGRPGAPWKRAAGSEGGWNKHIVFAPYWFDVVHS